MNKLLSMIIVSTVMSVPVALVSTQAHAKVVVEESGSDAYFEVDGKKASPAEASEAAKTSDDIKKCTPIKGAITSDGKPAYKCKQVVKRINPKTGNSNWKPL